MVQILYRKLQRERRSATVITKGVGLVIFDGVERVSGRTAQRCSRQRRASPKFNSLLGASKTSLRLERPVVRQILYGIALKIYATASQRHQRCYARSAAALWLFSPGGGQCSRLVEEKAVRLGGTR